MANEQSVKYPNITAKLTGGDGNAFFIIGKVRRALRAGGVSDVELDQFSTEAQSGDYDNVLVTCMRWCNVE